MTKRNTAIKLFALSMLFMVILTSCVNNTTYPGTQNIIEASDAIANANQPNVILLDARGEEAYSKGHAKGAISLSPTELISDNPVSMSLPSKEQLERVLGSKGISNDTTVYIYDNNGGVSASRIWWTMRVFGHENVMVINGGEAALLRAGVELSIDAPVISPVTYTAKALDESKIITFEELEALIESDSQEFVLLDVRSIAEFEEGYIPTARLYPHTRNLYKDGTFMSSRDLGLFYKDFGIEKDDFVILYCKSSFRATQTVALLEEAGFTNLKIYDGAWIEWENRSDMITPVEPVAPVGGSDGS